ncbi:hypothetical protein [Arthrobacter bambusae]|uniref:hypothetical protein n=1 Tax=Arthrobacter bambusae TaxID=1338426 RepID=UPI0027849281|nr:hypothetical protein [Arthrobacter bambusae]MDQ0241240.1 hypothetical protein [Arthrobacter bambusae]
MSDNTHIPEDDILAHTLWSEIGTITGGAAVRAADLIRGRFVLIPRRDLPKVELDGNRAYGGTCSRNIHEGLGEIRDTAFALLAIGEFIESQGPKIAHRKERRDELASEFTAAGSYGGQLPYTQKLIDRIIDLEQAAK